MSCHRVRIAISALLDGETADLPASSVERHLHTCAACARFRDEAAALQRLTRVDRAPEVADLTPRILHAIGAEPSPMRPSPLRLGLAAIAMVQLVASLPALVLGEDAGLPVHTARHLGSFGVALAIGFLFVAWKPARVSGILPVAVALVACLVGTSALDVAEGRTAAIGELGHATELAGVVVLSLMERARGTQRLLPA